MGNPRSSKAMGRLTQKLLVYLGQNFLSEISKANVNQKVRRPGVSPVVTQGSPGGLVKVWLRNDIPIAPEAVVSTEWQNRLDASQDRDRGN
jgi:hypothetical protein